MAGSLARSVRISNAKEFAHIFKKGRHSQSKFWKIVVSNTDYSLSRLGLAISKKEYKKAVDRNLLNHPLIFGLHFQHLEIMRKDI